MAAEFGPEAQRRVKPMIARWLHNAILASVKGGRHDVLRQIAVNHGQYISPDLRALCRVMPRTPLAAVGKIKDALKSLRGKL
jgi:hypothetical protein